MRSHIGNLWRGSDLQVHVKVDCDVSITNLTDTVWRWVPPARHHDRDECTWIRWSSLGRWDCCLSTVATHGHLCLRGASISAPPLRRSIEGLDVLLALPIFVGRSTSEPSQETFHQEAGWERKREEGQRKDFNSENTSNHSTDVCSCSSLVTTNTWCSEQFRVGWSFTMTVPHFNRLHMYTVWKRSNVRSWKRLN